MLLQPESVRAEVLRQYPCVTDTLLLCADCGALCEVAVRQLALFMAVPLDTPTLPETKAALWPQVQRFCAWLSATPDPQNCLAGLQALQEVVHLLFDAESPATPDAMAYSHQMWRQRLALQALLCQCLSAVLRNLSATVPESEAPSDRGECRNTAGSLNLQVPGGQGRARGGRRVRGGAALATRASLGLGTGAGGPCGPLCASMSRRGTWHRPDSEGDAPTACLRGTHQNFAVNEEGSVLEGS